MGFDILSLIGEPWIDPGSEYRGIGVAVTEIASAPSSKFLEFLLNGASIYRVLKTGETIISDAAGTSLGGIKLAGAAGEMALTSMVDATTNAPAEALRYGWEDTGHVGYDPASAAVLQGMGAARFSITGAGTIAHVAGNSSYEWQGAAGDRIVWTGLNAATTIGKTIEFSNVGQTPTRATPILSIAAQNDEDDLLHFGLSDGTARSVKAKVDAAGRALFQSLDVTEQGAPGDPAAAAARIYGKNVNGVTKLAFRDSTGAETVLGSTLTVAGGTVTADTPVASFSQTWNEAHSTFNVITASIDDQGSRANSNLINFQVGAAAGYQVRSTGETIISRNAGTSLGGIKLVGNAGEMALTSQISSATGNPAEVLRYYWEGTPGEVAALRGMGTNRLSIESIGAIVHIADNSRYEWEGRGAARLSFVSFETATASGKTLDFNNLGQTPSRASPVVSISVADAADDPLHIGTLGGIDTVWTTLARFDGTGVLHAPSVNVTGISGGAPAFAARLSGDQHARASMGLDASNRGVIQLGLGGATPPDVTLARDVVAGSLGISNGTAPAQIRIYRTYANGGAEAEFWNMTWRVATTVPWASIRTSFTGVGEMRNICIEPPLIGLGVPIGTGSNIPALKRVGTTLQIRLGDDTDFTAIRGKLTTVEAAVEETIVADRVLILYDASGTAYKVPCVAA